MKIRISDPTKDVSLINRAFEQQEQLTNTVADLKAHVFTQVNLPQSKGQGSPEGNVAAPVGSIYQRTDGSSGTTLYVKESGNVSNVGWVPVNSGGGGAVTSVFGRTGAVVAVNGDYNFNQLAGSIAYGQMPNSGVTATSYTNTNITVNAQGIITAASNGSSSSNPAQVALYVEYFK